MSTTHVALPYPVDTLIEVHYDHGQGWDTDPDVRLAVVEAVDADSLTARIVAEWYAWNPRHLDLDAQGVTWTLYGKEVADGIAAVRVVQPDAVPEGVTI